MTDYKELARALRSVLPAKVQGDEYVSIGAAGIAEAADALEKLADEVERRADFMARQGYRPCDIPACNCKSWHGGHAYARLGEIRDELETNGTTILGAVQKLKAEVERWEDPDSDERQKLQEEIIFSLGEGSRSEVELREGQLAQMEAALALARAEVERLTKERDEWRDSCLRAQSESHAWSEMLDEAREERDEALAARETYAMTARQDIIEKAKALDELEALLGGGSALSEAVLGPNKRLDGSVAGWSCELWKDVEFRHVVDLAPTLAAAIRAALEKARGA